MTFNYYQNYKKLLKKQRKYRNKTCKCKSNHIHDSRGEADYCDILRLQKQAREIKDYKIQVKYPLKIEGERLCTHIVDFLVTLPDGSQEVREYKGMPTRVWRLKYKIFLKNYPNLPYKIVTKKDLMRIKR